MLRLSGFYKVAQLATFFQIVFFNVMMAQPHVDTNQPTSWAYDRDGGIQKRSQSINFTGIVSSTQDGRRLKDVYVRLLDEDQATLTDVKGEFQLPFVGQKSMTIVFDKPGFVVLEKKIPEGQNTIAVQLSPKKMSAASYRWLNYIESEAAYRKLEYKENTDWKLDFKQTNLLGDFAPDTNLIRRDPSAVIKVGKTFYCYYTRGVRYAKGPDKKFFPWDQCDVWYATSTDGLKWKEKGPAVERGLTGSIDDRSVFTPEILAHKSRYYLVYQAVKAPYVFTVQNTVGMAVSDSPDGPWTKLKEPILRPTNNGLWKKNEDIALRKGDFDSHKVHDPCLLYYKDKFYLYYKGERFGEERFFGEREIKWGVAIADNPEGPYIKSAYNPLTNSGHEVCIWPYNGGIALVSTLDGPEAKTVQWAADGINFEIMSTVTNTPHALGLYRTPDSDKGPLEGIRWGLAHAAGGGNWRTAWNYIKRFEVIQKK